LMYHEVTVVPTCGVKVGSSVKKNRSVNKIDGAKVSRDVLTASKTDLTRSSGKN
jgi:hypothetical protein